MNDLRKRIQRRRARAIQKGRAVSPVVATLILILIAVAAAAALYLWLVSWQGNITGGIGNQQTQATITIGGSTSVYPFDEFARAQFQQNYSNIVISDNQGGSGAGMIAVCSGAVQIGATSSLQTPANLETPTYNCPTGALQAPVVTTVAYDGVDLITSVANAHGLISMAQDTLLTIYIHQSSSTTTITTGYTAPGTFNAAPAPAGALTWNQIPACVAAASGTGCAGGTEVAVATGAGGAACVGFPNDICGAVMTPCGWSVCAGGANNPVQTVQRSDFGGTTQSFTARMLEINNEAVITSLSALQSNWGGCGSDGQLASCGITATLSGLGNPGVISTVASHPDALGYASDGLARVSNSGVVCQGISTAACGIGFAGVGQTTAIQPSLGGSGTIATSIKTGETATAGYAGWRPFQWVTLGAPAGEVAAALHLRLGPVQQPELRHGGERDQHLLGLRVGS